MSLKKVIFDFDGTLVDSMGIWADVGIYLIEQCGKDVKPDLIEKVRQMSFVQATAFMKQEYSIPISENEMMEIMLKKVADFYAKEVVPKNGVCDLLEALFEKNIEMNIISANDRRLIELCIKNNSLEKYFSQIFTCGELELNKDDPEAFIKVAGKIGEKPEDLVLFDDSFYAIKAAKNARLKTIGVYDQHEPDTDKVKETSDIYLEDFTNTDLILKQIFE